ncbi:putative multidrug resistance protein fnx1 [Hypoxylon sp. NC1633]|nr:putative multidrug resistance protein fnx1 [Hypoxylon sp. NC1633]
MELERSVSEPKPNCLSGEPEKGFDNTQNATSTTVVGRSEHAKSYQHGLRFWLMASTLAVMVFLVVLEIPIVPTSLVSISNDIGGFDSLSWVLSGYLLGRVGVMIILAKLSDIVGRKLVFTSSIAMFIVFSGACGGAQTITQLIVFRALQGVGGGGAYSLSTVIITELVPPAGLAKATAQLSMVTTFANILGPIIGGAIANDTSWRWVFLINVPIAAAAFLIAIVAIPRGFPHKGHLQDTDPARKFASKPLFNRLDVVGTILLLLATVTFSAGFEEADSRFPWRSAYVITLISVSGLSWIALLLWERKVTLENGPREPVLPWRFFTNRSMAAILLMFFLLGGPLVVTAYQIPQMFQLVYGFNGLDAGVRLVPFMALWSVGLLIATTLAGRFKVPPLYIILVGSCIQTVGFGLLGTLPLSLTVPNQIYGYEVIAGLGSGLVFPLLFVMIPFITEGRDRSVGMAAGSQFQVLGSVILLAVATSVFNNYTRPRLSSLVGASGSESLFSLGEALKTVSDKARDEIRLTLAEGYNRQSLVLCGASGAQLLATPLLWKRKQTTV